MIEALIAGAALGLAAGLVPGPFLAYVAATAVEQGPRAALRVAFVPLVVETPPMIVAVVVLAQVPDGVLRWVGIVGGAAVALLGLYTFRRAPSAERVGRSEDGAGGTRRVLELAGAGLLSPAPWVFWTAIGGPLVLRHWRQGAGQAVAFVTSFFGLFVGCQMLVALASSRGVRFLSPDGRRRVLRGLSLLLVLAGTVLAWQAWTGNFQELVQTQEAVQGFVD